MKLFMYTIQLPVNVSEERQVISSEEVGSHILYWNTKELDKYYSGEFGWKKLESSVGVLALQYINRQRVRLMVRALTKEAADTIVKSFSWHLDAKKTGKKPYARRCSHTKLLMAGNMIATKNHIQVATQIATARG